MKLTNKVKQGIIEHTRIFIPNHREFFEQFNEQSIIYGRYLLHFINDDDVENNTINILTNLANFRYLHHFLADNHFSITQYNGLDISDLSLHTIKKYTNDIILYEKSVGDFTLYIHVIKTANVYNYLNYNIKLKIEQNYFNGSLIVLPFKKYTICKYEVNDRIKLNDQKITRKIAYYMKCGYSFKIITNNEKIVFKSHNYKHYKYYLNLIKYYF